MKNFLRTCMEDTRPLAILLGFLLLTGLRPGEALALRWEDVDLKGASLVVKRNVVWAGSTWHIGKPKTKAGQRVVALPASAVALLRRLPRNSVHCFWEQKPPSSKQLSNAMRQLCERARVPQKPARFLRRAHAALLAASGVDPKSLQKRMGHSQVSTTLDIYAYSLPEMDRKVAQLLDRALGA
jgi:integrase